MTSQGSPYSRFQRALQTGDLHLIRAAAAELPQVDLVDALAVCHVMARRADPAFERSAARWVARYTLERGAELADVRLVVGLFEALRTNAASSLPALEALARDRSGAGTGTAPDRRVR